MQQFLVSPLGRAAMVGLGFAIFLLTYVFFTSGPGLYIGFVLGLVIMVLPFGIGGRYRRGARPRARGPSSPPSEGDRR